MKTILKGLALLVVAVLVAALVGKNTMAKAAVQNAVKAVTGLKMEVGSLDVRLLKTCVEVKDLKLHNPADFRDPVMFDLPQVKIDYSLGALLKNQVHLTELSVYLKELHIIKNSNGQLNISALKPAGSGAPAAAPKGQAPAAGGQKAPGVRIDVLNLRVDKVIYKDYSAGGSPKTQEFSVGLNESFQNITNPNVLVPLLVSKALANTTVAALARFNPKELMSNFNLEGVSLDRLSGNMAQVASKAQVEAVKVLGAAGKQLQAIPTEKAAGALSALTASAQNAAAKAGAAAGGAAGSGSSSAQDLTQKARDAVAGLGGLFGDEKK